MSGRYPSAPSPARSFVALSPRSGISQDHALLTLFPESLGVTVEQREIDRTELYVADEAFFAGTAAEVTPILSVDRRPVGEGVMGPLTAKVRDAYFGAVRDGSAPHPEWRRAVYR